ncbi:hypothetical protein Ciccas_002577 [Cichlidogyrus casuarinus]|uniref:Uncharacterized protein n=1 Tax=Cichlidogyrus casuarinus TaxID=1844966 RepID=A0ABD2QGU8_9PLAT
MWVQSYCDPKSPTKSLGCYAEEPDANPNSPDYNMVQRPVKIPFHRLRRLSTEQPTVSTELTTPTPVVYCIDEESTKYYNEGELVVGDRITCDYRLVFEPHEKLFSECVRTEPWYR